MSRRNVRYKIGIDEVGRGPLAGPVTVCAAAFPPSFSFAEAERAVGPLRDSKRLSPARRNRWAQYLRGRGGICYAITSISPARIDQVNIRNATNDAVGNALAKLSVVLGSRISSAYIYMDGGLEVPEVRLRALKLRHAPQAIVRGDATVLAIAAASILAKVARDRYMERLAKRHPGYGLEAHKGYGTRAHYAAIRVHGISPIHRRSFLKNI